MKFRLLFAGCVWLLGVFGRVVNANQLPLSITNAGGEITISWPVAAGNWALEGTPVLPPAASWGGVVPEFDQTNGAIRRVGIAPGDTNHFFRLRRLDVGVPGMTGRWTLDEGAGQVALDGTGIGGVLFIEGATWASGRIGTGSLQFNGNAGASGSRCWVSNSNYQVLPGPGQPFSVSFWFSPDALTPGSRGLAGTDANGSNGWRVALSTTGPGTNYLVFAGVGSGASLSVTGRTLLLPGQWYQLAATFDGAAGNLYLDGVRLASGVGTIQAHAGPVYFGGGVGGYNSFLGRIDDVRTFKSCLAEERVSLTGEWLFDEGAGTFGADSSGGEHHASFSESAARVPGRLGGGVDLNSGQVAIPNDDLSVLPPSGKPFSVSFWLRPSVLAPGRFGLMNNGLDGINGWQMAAVIGESGQAVLHLSSTNLGGTLDLTAPVPLAASVWAKLDVTFNGGIATIYCNGRKVGAGSGAIRASRAPIVIGSVAGLAKFPGVVDELKFHGSEKGESQIGPVAPVMWETALMNTMTNFVLGGSGPTGRPLVYSIVPTIVPTNGTVTITPGSSVAIYVAGARKGPDAFTYTVSDGEFTSAPSIFTVSVVEPHWLSPTGGSEGPVDGRSPSTAWVAGTAKALDAIWKTNTHYDCFFYGPGEYQTRGWKYYERSTANPGCKHVGSGSEGSGKTTLRLVDAWESWADGIIFCPFHGGQTVDGFEVHSMVLDCNADRVPKYVTGEPVWIRIPLATSGRVDTVKLRWANTVASGISPTLTIGRAANFSVSGLRSATTIYSTNFAALVNTSLVNVVSIGVEVDELLLQLDLRAARIDFYGLSEIEISGAAASLPSAAIPGGGGESRLGSPYSIVMAVDEDHGTAWASGPETQARIELPLASGTVISQLNLYWNCKHVSGVGQLGPASDYLVQARDASSGLYVDVPFVRHPRAASGEEVVTFGTAQSTNSVATDRLVILLTSRDQGVDYYSLREVTLQNGFVPVRFRLPTSLNSFVSGSYSILRAFDRDNSTEWASGTQGAVSAISLGGNNLKFTDLKIVGFGTKAGREVFPMFLWPPFDGPVTRFGNVLVDSCVFRQPATNNTDGATVVAIGGSPKVSLTNAVVRRCIVSGLRPYFSYSHATAAMRVENCTVVDCSEGVYFEPDSSVVDSVGPVVIRSNSFVNVDSGVYLAVHPGANFESITCLNNEMILSGRRGWGFAICDTCYVGRTGTCTNVAVLNNIIRYSDWSPRPLGADGGLYYSDLQHAVFGNNVVALGTSSSLRVRWCPSGIIPPPPGDCEHFVPVPPDPTYPPCLDILLPGYRRAWFNNRNLSGDLIPVRYSSDGVDGLSSHQQWPE